MSKPRHSVTVPAGKYVLGDPCYSIRDEDWMSWLEEGGLDLVNTEPYHIMVAKTTWGLAIGVGTEYGDGTYTDQFGNSFPVDAGMIGLVAFGPGIKNSLGDDRIVIELTEDTLVEKRQSNGDIVIGPHIIRTGDTWECEDCGVETEEYSYICGPCDDEREREDNKCPECGDPNNDFGSLCDSCAEDED